MKKTIVAAMAVFSAAALFAAVGYDHSVAEFPRLAGETDDTPRLQRAVDACERGVLFVPKGDYELASTLVLRGNASVSMHPFAKLKAVKDMDYVVDVRHGKIWDQLAFLTYIEGGAIDAAGRASCLNVESYWAYNVRDIKLFNAKKYGLRVSKRGGELVAHRVYILTRMHGLAGNVGMFLEGGDSHYDDIFILDCTTGVIARGCANRLTRIHVWGGSLPVLKKGDLPEMLKDSVAFRIEGHNTELRDCYADTAQIGFDVFNAWEVRCMGCTFFNNVTFGLNDLTIVRQQGDSGALLFSDCVFTRSGKKERIKVYEGKGGVSWSNLIYAGGDWTGIEQPGRGKKKSDTDDGKLDSPKQNHLAGY